MLQQPIRVISLVLILIAILVNDAAATAPTFVKGLSASLSVCRNSSENSIDSLLRVAYPTSTDTLTWSILSAPSHGLINGLPFGATAASDTVTTSNVKYTPASNYVGNDTFKVKVCTSTDSAVVIIYATVRETAPPVAVHNVQYCQYASDTALVAAGSSLLWYPTVTGGAGSTLAPIPSTSVVGLTRYYVSQTLNGCESLRDSVTVKINALPTISVSPAIDTICSTYSTSLVASGGVSYTWTPLTNLSSTTGASVIASPLSTRIYSVTGTDSNSCKSTATTTVIVNPKPAAVNIIGGQDVTCIGIQTTLTDATPGGVWTSSIPTVAAISSLGVLTGNDTGATTIFYTIPATGCFSSRPISVHEYNLHLPTLNTCFGNSIQIRDPATNFLWGIDPGNSLGNHYTHYFYSTAGGCQVDYAVNVNPYPNPINGDSILCQGKTSQLTNDSVGTWTSSNPGIASVDAGGLVSAIGPDTATITFTLPTGCAASVGIVVNPKPDVTITPATSAICLGSSTVLSAHGAFTYHWSPATAISSTATSSVSVNPSAVITYTVIGEDVYGCLDTAARTVNVNSLPSVNVSTGSSTICSGQNTTVTATGASSYSWSPATGLTSSTGATVSMSPSSTIIYTVTGRDLNNCTNKATTTVSVNPLPAISSSSISICIGQSTTLSVGGGISYSWIPGTGLSSTVDSSVICNTSTSTIYTVTATGSNSCSKTVTKAVTVNPLPVVTIIPDQMVCQGATISIAAFSSSLPGTTYTWTNSNPSIGLAASGIGNIPSFTATNTTDSIIIAQITVIPRASSCDGASRTFNIAIKPNPVLSTITNQQICNGTSSTLVHFTSNAIVGSPTTYSWINNNSSIGLATTGTLDIGVFTAINTGTTTAVATITVTPTANGCIGSSRVFAISVNPTPSVDSISNISLCNGAAVGSILFNGPIGGTSFQWTNSDNTIGIAGSGIGNILSFSAINISDTIHNANINVVPVANTCSGVARHFTIQVKPTPIVTSISNPTYCKNQSVATTVLTSNVSGTTYTWTNSNTTVGLPANGTGNIPGFTATNSTSSAITGNIAIAPIANGCAGPVLNYTVTVKPAPTVNAVTSTGACNGNSVPSILFSGLGITGFPTTYNWIGTNSSIGLASSGSGNIPSFTGINSLTTPVIDSITVIPSANGCSGNSTNFTITISPKPIIYPIPDTTLCSGSINPSVIFASSISGTTFSWTNSNTTIGLGATGTGNLPTFTSANSGITNNTANIIVTPISGGCNGLSDTFTITVNPLPNVVPVPNQILCNGAVTTLVTFTSSIPGTTFNWTNSDTSVGLAASGTGNIAAFAAINTGTVNKTASIQVIPSVNGCSGAPITFSITVKPTPSVNALSDTTICANTSTLPVVFANPVSGTTYAWTNTNTSIGLSATGSGPINSFTALNTDTVSSIAVIVVSPSANSCPGPSRSFTYYVKPVPTINSIANIAHCANEQVAHILFSGQQVHGAATNYIWSNSNSTIGLPVSGADSITAFGALNSGTIPTIASLTVTPSASGCYGVPRNFTITVNPIPQVSTVASQNVCNGSTTAPINFTSTVAGTIFHWTNADASIGLAGSGTGNISAFSAINSSFNNVNDTITVVPEANGCLGSSIKLGITVKPTPNVAVVPNQSVCVNSSTSLVSFSGNVAGTVFSWVNNNTAIGVSSAGTGNIPSFTSLNTGTSAITSVFTVTPSSSSCNGTPLNFSITVKPAPVMALVADTFVCNGNLFGGQNFNSVPVTGYATTYSWTNSNAGIGLASAGIGSLSSFTGSNSDSSTLTATIVVTPSANGCSGAPRSFVLSVRPTPLIHSISDIITCNGTAISPLPFVSSVPGATYSWTNSTPSIGVSASGVGNIGGFTAMNGSTDTIAGTIAVLANVNTCLSPSSIFRIIVRPTPLVATISPIVACNNDTVSTVHFFGTAITGYPTHYTWTSSLPTTGMGPSGVDSIASFTATNALSTVLISTITVTSHANGCDGMPMSFPVQVNPTPTLYPPSDIRICNGIDQVGVSLSGPVSGTAITWTNSNTAIGLAATGTGNIPAFIAHNTSIDSTVGVITVNPTANGCAGISRHFSITVLPAPTVFAISDTNVCNGEVVSSVHFNGSSVAGYPTTYTWLNDNSTIGIAPAGAGDSINSFIGLNSSNVPSVSNFTVTPSANGCSGGSRQFSIGILPTPILNPIADASYCNGDMVSIPAFSSSVPSSTYSWSNSNTTIGLGSVGSGTLPNFTGSNSTFSSNNGSIIVTPSAAGCLGASAHFNINIKPTPTVHPLISQFVCNGASNSTINFAGDVAATIFSWNNSLSSIGLPASGSGNILPATMVNSGVSNATATFTVIPTSNGCVGSSQTFQVTVYPTPTVATPSDQFICNSSTTSLVAFAGAVTATSFHWTNSDTTIGLGSSGFGNIPVFIATNLSSATHDAAVTVTPTANGCSGPSGSFHYFVKPTPHIDPISSQSLCNHSSTSDIVYTGPVSGTSYSWVNTLPSIGLLSSGVGTIPSFTATNSDSVNVVATITTTPSAQGCVGPSETLTITVFPTPEIHSMVDIVICNQDTVTFNSFISSVASTSFNWTNSLPTIGLSNAGVGNIPAFIATNTANINHIATVTATPTANGCSGLADTFRITVKPTPILSMSGSQELCNGSVTAPLSFNSSVLGTIYTWTNSDVSIGLASSGSGSIPSFVTVIPDTSIHIATISVLPVANGCPGDTGIETVKVNPTPFDIAGDSVVCVASEIPLTDAFPGGTWTSSAISVGTVNLLGHVTGLTEGYTTITYTLPTGCYKTKTIHVNPIPGPILGVDSVCVGATDMAFDASSGGAWTVTDPTISTITASGLITGRIAGIDTVIYYYPPTGCKVSAPLKVNPLPSTLLGDTLGCVGSPLTLVDSFGNVLYNITPVTPGILTVVLSTTSYCSSHLSIHVNSLPSVIAGDTGLCLGTYSLLTNGTPGGVWSSSDTTVATISSSGLVHATGLGTATITYTLATGCYKTTRVDVNSLFTINVGSLLNPANCFGNEGVIKLNGVGTSTVYDVAYLKNGTYNHRVISSTAANELYIDSLTAGGYTNIRVSLSGCTSNFVSATLSDPLYPASPSIVTNQPLCVGSTLYLGASDTSAGVTFNWAGPEGFYSTHATDSVNSVTILRSGFYQVAAVRNNCSTIDSVYVQVIAPPVAASISGSELVCEGATALFSDSVSGGHWQMKFSHAFIDSTTGVLHALDFGQDTVIYAMMNMCGVDTAKKGVFIDRIPIVQPITGPAYICTSTSVSLHSEPVGGTWSLSNANITHDSSSYFTGVIPGADTIYYTVSNTCGSTTVKRNESITAPPVSASISGPASLCVNETISLVPSIGGGSWSVNTPAIAIVGSAGTVTGISSGASTVQYHLENVCGYADSYDTVLVRPLPYAGLIMGDSFICSGESTVLHSSTPGGYWLAPGSSAFTLSPIGINLDSASVFGSIPGTAPVFYVYHNSCGNDTVSEVVTVNGHPVLSSSLTPPAICSGSAFIYTPSSITTGSSFSWNRDTIAGILNSASYGLGNINEVLISNTPLPIAVTYHVTTMALGCTSTQDVVVIVNPIPALSSAISLTACSNAPFNYIATSLTPSVSYYWTRDSVFGVLPVSGNGGTTIGETLVNATGGPVAVTYYFTLSANGCSATQSINVTLESNAPEKPLITTMSPSYLCTNTMYQNFGAHTVPPAGIHYAWSAHNAEVWATGETEQYCLVNFQHPGFSSVILSASYTGYTCASNDSFVVFVGGPVSAIPDVHYFHPDFVCAFWPEWTFQWGYDDVGTLDSTIIPFETNQNYYEPNPDFTHKYYWVITTYQDCFQKTYFRIPTQIQNLNNDKILKMEVYPNPTTGNFVVDVSTAMDQSGKLTVYDLWGRKLYDTDIATNRKVPVFSDIASGIYIVEFRSASLVASKRLIIEK